MTILESSLLLIEWFRENSSYIHSLEEKTADNRQIMPIAEDVPIMLHSFHLALQDMVESKMLKSSKLNDKETLYLLNRPLATMNQTIELSFETCAYLADMINRFNENVGADELVDPTRLTEKDIRMAADLIEFLTSDDEGVCDSCGGPLDQNGDCAGGDDEHDLPKPNADGSMPIQKAPIKPKKPKPGEDGVNPSNN